MKIRVLTLIGAAALGAAGGAYATSGATVRAVTLSPGMAAEYAGLTCTAYAGTTPTNANLVCVRNNLLGYGVVVSQDQVIVARSVSGKIKILFQKANT